MENNNDTVFEVIGPQSQNGCLGLRLLLDHFDKKIIGNDKESKDQWEEVNKYILNFEEELPTFDFSLNLNISQCVSDPYQDLGNILKIVDEGSRKEAVDKFLFQWLKLANPNAKPEELKQLIKKRKPMKSNISQDQSEEEEDCGIKQDKQNFFDSFDESNEASNNSENEDDILFTDPKEIEFDKISLENDEMITDSLNPSMGQNQFNNIMNQQSVDSNLNQTQSSMDLGQTHIDYVKINQQLRTKLQQLENEKNEFRAENRNFKKNFVAVKKLLGKLNQQETKMNLLIEENNRLKKENEKKEEQFTENQTRIENHMLEIQGYKESGKTNQKESDKIRKELITAEEKTKEAQKESKKCTKLNKQYSEEVSSLNTKLRKNDKFVSALKNRIAGLKVEITEKDKEKTLYDQSRKKLMKMFEKCYLLDCDDEDSLSD